MKEGKSKKEKVFVKSMRPGMFSSRVSDSGDALDSEVVRAFFHNLPGIIETSTKIISEGKHAQLSSLSGFMSLLVSDEISIVRVIGAMLKNPKELLSFALRVKSIYHALEREIGKDSLKDIAAILKSKTMRQILLSKDFGVFLSNSRNKIDIAIQSFQADIKDTIITGLAVSQEVIIHAIKILLEREDVAEILWGLLSNIVPTLEAILQDEKSPIYEAMTTIGIKDPAKLIPIVKQLPAILYSVLSKKEGRALLRDILGLVVINEENNQIDVAETLKKALPKLLKLELVVDEEVVKSLRVVMGDILSLVLELQGLDSNSAEVESLKSFVSGDILSSIPTILKEVSKVSEIIQSSIYHVEEERSVEEHSEGDTEEEMAASMEAEKKKALLGMVSAIIEDLKTKEIDLVSLKKGLGLFDILDVKVLALLLSDRTLDQLQGIVEGIEFDGADTFVRPETVISGIELVQVFFSDKDASRLLSNVLFDRLSEYTQEREISDAQNAKSLLALNVRTAALVLPIILPQLSGLVQRITDGDKAAIRKIMAYSYNMQRLQLPVLTEKERSECIGFISDPKNAVSKVEVIQLMTMLFQNLDMGVFGELMGVLSENIVISGEMSAKYHILQDGAIVRDGIGILKQVITSFDAPEIGALLGETLGVISKSESNKDIQGAISKLIEGMLIAFADSITELQIDQFCMKHKEVIVPLLDEFLDSRGYKSITGCPSADNIIKSLTQEKSLLHVQALIKAGARRTVFQTLKASANLALHLDKDVRAFFIDIIAFEIKRFIRSLEPDWLKRMLAGTGINSAMSSVLKGTAETKRDLGLLLREQNVPGLAKFLLYTKDLSGQLITSSSFNDCTIAGFNFKRVVFVRELDLSNSVISDTDFSKCTLKGGFNLSNAVIDIASLGTLLDVLRRGEIEIDQKKVKDLRLSALPSSQEELRIMEEIKRMMPTLCLDPKKSAIVLSRV